MKQKKGHHFNPEASNHGYDDDDMMMMEPWFQRDIIGPRIFLYEIFSCLYFTYKNA